ncbi:hypothetical protein BOH76_19275 [Escherichia coli]|nr:hypothetical protein BOH76_19275 [Escherichia coli]
MKTQPATGETYPKSDLFNKALWYTWGQKETGEWQWTFQVGDLENVNITHWAVMPKAPEAGA